jgi:23S rRNA G2069 N7-methylase RlmK/C1962 C5-methylase RlmI
MSGFRVTHVDSSKPAIQWAKTNLELNQSIEESSNDISIRWILEDALSFCRREVRRHRKYEVICLDPPTYGHGHGAQTWRLERDLPILFDSISELLSESAMAVTLTGHSQRELFESLLEHPALIRMNDRFIQRSLASVDITARKNSNVLNAGYCYSWWN